MPKTRFWNFGEGPHKKGNVADDSGAELNEMNSPIPTESKVKPEYSTRSTKGMFSQLRGACAAFAKSFRPGMSSSGICAVSRTNKGCSVFIDSIGKLIIFAQMGLLGKLQMYCFWVYFFIPLQTLGFYCVFFKIN